MKRDGLVFAVLLTLFSNFAHKLTSCRHCVVEGNVEKWRRRPFILSVVPRIASWEDGSDWLNLEIGGATGECPRIAPRRNGIRDRDSRRDGRVFSALQPINCVDCHLSQGTVSSKEMSGNEDTNLLYRQCHILLFYFILFNFI